MEYLFIYLLQMLDMLNCVKFFSCFLVVILVIIFTITLLYCGENQINIFDKDYKDKKGVKDVMLFFNILKKIAIVPVALIIFISVIPTKQTLLLMGGTYLGKKAVNAVITDEKIKKVDTIINLQLDKYIKELQGQN